MAWPAICYIGTALLYVLRIFAIVVVSCTEIGCAFVGIWGDE